MNSPLPNGKWELVAQKHALGESWPRSYKLAGFTNARPGIAVARLLKAHPEIKERSSFLQERIFDRQVDTQIMTRDQVLMGLAENIRNAKLAKPIIIRGEIQGYTADFGAINGGYKLIAEIQGMVIKKSEQKTGKLDPFEDANPAALVQMIEGSFEKLGIEFDGRQFAAALGLTGQTETAGQNGSGAAVPKAEVLEALPRPRDLWEPGEEVPVETVDGRQPSGEVGVRIGGSSDAPDGNVPPVLEGQEVREADSSLGGGSDQPDDPRRDPKEANGGSR